MNRKSLLSLILSIILAAAVQAQAPATPEKSAPEEKPDPTTKPEDAKAFEEFIRGATLETDSEIQAMLRRAREHLDEKRFREAVTVLQHVIDQPTNSLSTVDGRVYRSCRRMAAEMVASMPPEGLSTYRLWADGEARGLLGDVQACVDMDALRQVVRRFFMSSLGDAAALRLASLALDQHDYAQARRLLLDILHVHPKPAVDRAAVYARLVVACARLDDTAGAQAALKELTALRSSTFDPPTLAALEREVQSSAQRRRPVPQDWRMAFGSAQRQGVALDLPAGLLKPEDPLWTVAWELTYPSEMPGNVEGRRTVPASAQVNKRDMLLAWWETSKAVPTGQLAISEGRVYYKTLESLVCAEAQSGKRLWESKEGAAHDPQTAGMVYYGPSYGYIPPERQGIFIDHIGRALSLVEGAVYHITDNHRAAPGMGVGRVFRIAVNGKPVNVKGQPQQPPKPLEGNALAAHDARTGKLLWRLGRSVDAEKPLAAVRFLTPPVGCLGKLLVVAEEKGEMVLLALDPSDGAVLWRSFLCASVSTGGVSLRPVGLYVEGTEVLVSSGKGVVFALDATDGALLWAARYEPAQSREEAAGRFWGRYRSDSVDGWQESYVAASGSIVITAPTDAESIQVFDRRSGKFLYAKPVRRPRYCIGMLDGGLYYMSAEGVTRLDLAGGQVAWTQPVSQVQGRAVLAGSALYVPSGSTILRLDAATGTVRAHLRASLPAGDPVGNLWVAGNQLLVAGMDRIVALTNARERFDELDRRLAQNPTVETLLERAHLARDAGRSSACLRDLQRAWEMLTGEARNTLRPELIKALLDVARGQPTAAESHLKQAAALAESAQERSSVAYARAAAYGQQGKTLESARAWCDVVAASDRELLPTADERTLSRAPWTLGAAALQELFTQQAGTQGELTALAEAAFRQATANVGNGVSPLARALAPAVSLPALRDWVAKTRAAGRPEAAAALLSDLARSDDPRRSAAALAALAEVQQTDGARRQAAHTWGQLAACFPETPVEGVEGSPTGAALARQKLADRSLASPGRAFGPPPWKLDWSRAGAGLTLLQSPGDTPCDFLDDHVIIRSFSDGYDRCYAMADGKLQWEFAFRSGGDKSGNTSYYYGRTAGLTHDQGILVTVESRNLTARSLRTGKVLWSHLLSAEMPSYGSYGWDQALAADSGVVAARISPNVLRVYDLATGLPRWERTFRLQQVTFVAVRNGYVVASMTGMGGGGTTHIYDRLTGRMLAQLGNGQVYSHMRNSQAWTRDGFVTWTYEATGMVLAAWDVASGKRRWTQNWAGGGTLQSMEVIRVDGQERILLASLQLVTALDPATGKVFWEHNLIEGDAGIAYGQMGIRQRGEELLVAARQVSRLNPTRETFKVFTISLRNGKRLHTQTLTESAVRSSPLWTLTPPPEGDWMPLVRMLPQPAPEKGKAIVRAVVQTFEPVVFNIRGQGEPQTLPLPGNRKHLEYPVAAPWVIGNKLVLTHKDGVLVYSSAKGDQALKEAAK